MSDPIRLLDPVEVAGATYESLEMRTPRARDLRGAEARGGTDEDVEIRLFAELCGCDTAVMDELYWRDYAGLQRRYRELVEDPAPPDQRDPAAPMAPVAIPLLDPVEVAGTTYESLEMRPPRVRDQREAARGGGTEADFNARLLTALCGVGPGVIDELHERDYRRVKRAYNGFLAVP